MDDFVVWLQAKVGPMTFGAILGFVLQVLIFRPTHWMIAAERAVAAIIMSVLFAKPALSVVERMMPGLDRDVALTTAASLLALGGIELVRVVRVRFINTIKGGADE